LTSSKVLIVLPTYNRRDFLEESVQSVLTQEYADWQLIIVDDGSTDNTRPCCEFLVAKQPGRIFYQYQPNRGCACARNAGLQWLDDSFGFVCFLDSDDRFLPGKLGREVQLLTEHPAAGFTYSDYLFFDGQEHLQKVAAAGNPAAFALQHFLTNEAKSSCLLYRRSVIQGRLFREDFRYNEDSDFLQRIALENQGVYCPQPGCWIRWHAGSKSRQQLEIQKAVLQSSLDILRDYPEFAQQHAPVLKARIRQIQQGLFRELTKRKSWEEANQHAITLAEKLVVMLQISFCYDWLGYLAFWLRLLAGTIGSSPILSRAASRH
jgi:glycosyltransferase involved in cell wall biosynthesis